MNKVKIQFTGFALASFICGTTYLNVIKFVGELYLAEILLVLVALAALVFGNTRQLFQSRVFILFMITIAACLLGYMISDLSIGTSQIDYLRGWSRIIVTATDIAALAAITAIDRRNLWWFFLGMAVGGVVTLMVQGYPIQYWKFGYGLPVILFTGCLAYILPARIISFLFITLGVFSMFMDSRLQGALCLAVAGIVWARAGAARLSVDSARKLIKMGVVGAATATILVLAVQLTQTDNAARRDISNLYRFTAIKIGLTAIMDSPIIGYGSWGKGTEKYALQYYKETASELSKMGIDAERGERLMAHSQIVQSWLEGGILGVIFFMYLGYAGSRGLYILALNRQYNFMTPLGLFVISNGLWHLFMSPFNGSHRLLIAVVCTTLIILDLEKKEILKISESKPIRSVDNEKHLSTRILARKKL